VIGDIEVLPTGAKGLGVFARRTFTPGEFTFRRRHGRIVRSSDLASLSDEDRQHLCELDFDRYAVILPPGCYLNHSCDPNAMRSGVKVVAWTAIDAGEEITVDYRLNAFDDNARYECACGSPSCTGEIVGSFFSLPADRQQRYWKFAPQFIREEYRRRCTS
jgi:SET domain-containing protein